MVGCKHKIPSKTLVLVGMMGVGKTCIGKRLAEMIGAPFFDADDEIEAAAGCSIEDIFEIYGEPAFRDVERRVIARLLDGPPLVLATGGGAFMDPSTRAKVRDAGVSIWLRADLDLLLSRVARRNNRPLLKNGNQKQKLRSLIEERYPVYAEADVVIDAGRETPDGTVARVLDTLAVYFDAQAAGAAAKRP